MGPEMHSGPDANRDAPCMIQPVIDAHHHIWRQADLPWLAGPMVPRIFGPYEPIRRDYPVEEYLADIAGSGVVKSVYVQANWPPDKAVDEAAWVQSRGRPHRLAAWHRRLCRPDGGGRPAGARRGWRVSRSSAASACSSTGTTIRNTASPGTPIVADDPVFRRNFAALADHGFSFDLQVFAPQMAGAARLAADHPGHDLHPPACGDARGPVGDRPRRNGIAACGCSRRSRT